MFAARKRVDSVYAAVRQAEKRIGIARAERLENFERADIFYSNILRRNDHIAFGNVGGHSAQFIGELLHLSLKLRQVAFF